MTQSVTLTSTDIILATSNSCLIHFMPAKECANIHLVSHRLLLARSGRAQADGALRQSGSQPIRGAGGVACEQRGPRDWLERRTIYAEREGSEDGCATQVSE
ncbi:hypothetical protein BaRGS_00028474, partial [Batillaria attramentaria]